MFDRIERLVERVLSRWRIGFYRARVSSPGRTHRRADVDADWGPTVRRARRISSPVLDVVPAAGTPVAVISQDGVLEFPAILGQVWDDTTPPDGMTVWFRAHLADQPGHVELGATDSVQVFVGDNPGELTPLASGKLRIGSADVDLVDVLSQVIEYLRFTAEQLAITTAGGSPLSSAANFTAIEAQLDALKTLFDQIKS